MLPTIPLDAFAVEELRREYQSADARGRIALLQNSQASVEIARLAVEDPNVEVRQWFARHGRNYESASVDGEMLEILRKDDDPFIRACVYANPGFSPMLGSVVTWAKSGQALAGMFVGAQQRDNWWREATHLERLGMVRNPEFQSCLLNELNIHELGLGREQQEELIWAFISRRDQDRQDGEKLWSVMAEWPEQSTLPPQVYRCVPVNDEVAAEAYSKTSNPEWRRAILLMLWERWGAPPPNRFEKTLELATKDTSGVCRLLAYAAVLRWRPWASRERSKQWRDLRIATRNDIYALSGLAKNPALSSKELRWVGRCANALVGSLKTDDSLWFNVGGDEGYSISEVDLLSQIRQDVERRITDLRLGKQLGKIRPSVDNHRRPSAQKFEQTQDEKLDYLTLVALSTSTFGLKTVFAVTGPALIVFALTYLFFHNVAIALFAFLSWSWLSSKIWLPSTNRVAPWLDPDEYIARMREYWSGRSEPRKPPLIQDRPAEELEREVKRRARRADLDERARKFQDERRKHLEAHSRSRDTFARSTRRNWYLLKRHLRSLTRR